MTHDHLDRMKEFTRKRPWTSWFIIVGFGVATAVFSIYGPSTIMVDHAIATSTR